MTDNVVYTHTIHNIRRFTECLYVKHGSKLAEFNDAKIPHNS